MPSGSWTAKTNMPSSRPTGGVASFLLSDNKIYIAGGVEDWTQSIIQDCREYAVLGDFWTSKTIVPLPARCRCTGLALGADLDTGYMFGGRASSASTHYNYCLEYTQSTNAWASKNNMPLNRAGHNNWALDTDNGILVAGTKYTTSQVFSPEIYRYTKSTDAYLQRTNIISPNRDSCASFFMGNKGYLCGGSPNVSSFVSSAGNQYDNDEYDDTAEVWTSLMDIIVPARSLSVGGALASSGCGYVIGGGGNKDCDEYNRSTNAWASKTDHPPGCSASAIEVTSANVLYVISGWSNQNVYSFTMPSVPWIADLTPAHEQLNVAVDTNLQFDILDETGVNMNTITVKINGVNAIVNGVFQANYSGTITELT